MEIEGHRSEVVQDGRWAWEGGEVQLEPSRWTFILMAVPGSYQLMSLFTPALIDRVEKRTLPSQWHS